MTDHNLPTPPCWNTSNKTHLHYEGEVAVLPNGEVKHLPTEVRDRARILWALNRRGPVTILAQCPNC